jgi:hypothetical protein
MIFSSLIYINNKGQCLDKQTYQTNCATYGVVSCEEYNGLTCDIGPGNLY